MKKFLIYKRNLYYRRYLFYLFFQILYRKSYYQIQIF